MSKNPPTLHLIRSLLALGAGVAAASGTAAADVVLAPYFRDHAVLQRDKPVPVWGRADPGEKVTVTFHSAIVTATAGTDGRWHVTLPPMSADATGADLAARGKNTAVARDILVGEVWLCSGQSNMGWPVRRALNAAAEIAAADFPLIRHFKTPPVSADAPSADAGGEWQVCRPATVGAFTAAGFYFGRGLFKKLNVPVGLLNCSWGGTPIEAWMSVGALATVLEPAEAVRRWRADADERQAGYETDLARWNQARAAAEKAGREFKRPRPRKPVDAVRRRPGGLYNAMIAPFAPAAIRGVIWYQGEANVGRHAEYRALFPALIRSWRADFQQGDIPFHYVQLANFRTNPAWPFQREAQDAALKLPNTGRAVAIDIGDSGNIHPQNKQEVGRRLALLALAGAYGLGGEFSGPEFAGAVREDGALRVKFTHAAGMKTKDPALPGFVIAGADKKFTPAAARIEGETVVVSAASVPAPVAVRYAWAADPPAPLYNAAGLPASPFRNDDWNE